MLNFWLVDVLSTVTIDGVNVPFDYINTYLNEADAIREAKKLSLNEDVIRVGVHKWERYADGERHSEDDDCIPYHYKDWSKEKE